MIVERLQLTNEPYQTHTISINGKICDFAFRYNGTTDLFAMDIDVLFNDGTIERSVRGIPMTTGIELVKPFDLGIGELIAADSADLSADSSIDNFGITYQVYSRTEDVS